MKVEINVLTVAKIIRHCQQQSGGSAAVTGQLLGMDKEDCLEITYAFPLPSKFDEDEMDEDEYQLEMMRSLRNANLDGNSVGWYQSSHLSSFINAFTVETQASYQESIASSVFLVYDPVLGKTGSVPLRAFRLDKDFLELYKNKQMNTKALLEKSFGVRPIFTELEIQVQNSLLIGSFISALGSSGSVSLFSGVEESALDKTMAKNLDFLSESLDDLSTQMSRLYGYNRAYMKQQHIISSLRQKKKMETGSDTLTSQEIATATKTLHEPSRLDLILSLQQAKDSSKLSQNLNEYAFCRKQF